MNHLRRRILGIDPGLGIIGFGAVDVLIGGQGTSADGAQYLGHSGSSEPVEFANPQWGVIRTPAGQSDSERLYELYHDLGAVLAQLQPDVAAVEKIFFFKNAKTLVPVSQARGVILLLLQQHGIPLFEYTPMQVKQAMTGYGKAEKRDVQELLVQVLGLDRIPKPDDAADALAMAYCHYQVYDRYQHALSPHA